MKPPALQPVECSQAHPKAKTNTIYKRITAKVQRLKMKSWVEIIVSGRSIEYRIRQDDLLDASRLDGCYALKTDVPKQDLSKEDVHARYKDLALVEHAFRTCKTGHLELRPIHVRLKEHTRAHVFIVMLAYRLVQELARCWRDVDTTVEEGIAELSRISAIEIRANGKTCGWRIPEPGEMGSQLLQKLEITLPKGMPSKGIKVSSRKKPTSWRKPATRKTS
jgi:transposase